MTTEFRVEGFEGRAGGSDDDDEVEVAVVDVGFEGDVDELPGVAERAASSSAIYSEYSEARM